MFNTSLSILMLSNVMVSSYIVYMLWKSRTSKVSKDTAVKVLMFPDGGIQCNYWTAGGCTYDGCTKLHHITNKTRLKMLLEAAEVSIDVCVFVLSCAVLLDALIDAHKRGVKVRILCDNMKISGSAHMIEDAGLNVRVDNSPAMMHHKFLIIDGEILLTGSYNWTSSGAAYNRENVLITVEPHVVEQYENEMETLWKKFEGSFKVRYEPISSTDVIRNRFVHRTSDMR